MRNMCGTIFYIKTNVLQDFHICMNVPLIFHLTHLSPMFHFYTPWKRQKTFSFLTFSGVIELEHWAKIG